MYVYNIMLNPYRDSNVRIMFWLVCVYLVRVGYWYVLYVIILCYVHNYMYVYNIMFMLSP